MKCRERLTYFEGVSAIIHRQANEDTRTSKYYYEPSFAIADFIAGLIMLLIRLIRVATV